MRAASWSGMEAQRVLGRDEVEPPLSLALQSARCGELLVGQSGGFRMHDIVDQRDDRILGAIH